MGLDCTVYAGLELLEAFPWDRKKQLSSHPLIDQNGVRYLSNYDQFPGASKLTEGFYRVERLRSWRVGPYSYYSRYRNFLAQLVGISSFNLLWERPDLLKNVPFFRQINFSDAHGHFDTEVCRKLAEDYAMFKTLIKNPEFFDTYQEFCVGFSLASENQGILVYH